MLKMSTLLPVFPKSSVVPSPEDSSPAMLHDSIPHFKDHIQYLNASYATFEKQNKFFP